MGLEWARNGFRFRCGLLAALLLSPAAAHAELLLAPGDVIELSIASAPDLKTRATVGVDGRMILPIIGAVPASGMTIDDLRGKLQDAYSKRAVTLRTPEGRTMITPVSPEEVSVTIAEYRPVYISGDLSRVGEVPYRPGMTVRQAIAVAGGYDVVRFRMNNPYIDAIDFNSQRATLLSELAQESERKKFLQAELERLSDPPTAAQPVAQQPAKNASSQSKSAPAPQPQTPQPSEPLSAIAAQFQAEREDYEKELIHLRENSRLLATRAAVLEEQKNREEEGSEQDSEEFERTRSLLEKGTTSTQRVSDARRAMLLSATRALQTGVEASQVKLAKDEIDRAIQKLYDQRRIRLYTELQETNTKLVSIQAQLNAVKQKMAVVGTMKSAWSSGKVGTPEIIVYRTANNNQEQFTGSEATPLLPGDVVEVTLHTGDE